MRRIPLFLLLVKARVDIIHILLIQPILSKPQPLAETLEVHDLARTQELDDVVDVGIVGKAQDVIVGHARLLLGGEVLGEVGDGIARDLHRRRRPRIAGGELREHAGRVVDEIGIEAGLLDLIYREVSRELVDDGADHLKMPQLLCAQRSIGNVPMYQI